MAFLFQFTLYQQKQQLIPDPLIATQNKPSSATMTIDFLRYSLLACTSISCESQAPLLLRTSNRHLQYTASTARPRLTRSPSLVINNDQCHSEQWQLQSLPYGNSTQTAERPVSVHLCTILSVFSSEIRSDNTIDRWSNSEKS